MAKKESNQIYGKKLTVPEIISYCKETLGITFNIKSEEEASVFLAKHNYFFRLKQYADFGEKTKSGKFINVDFGQMVELSTVDMFLRKLILKMTLDFEHYLKVKIINDSQENSSDDGYAVVENFLETHNRVRHLIENLYNSSYFYNRQVFDKYKEKTSVWSIVEMLGFSDFIDFYAHYYQYFHLKCEYTPHFDFGSTIIGEPKPRCVKALSEARLYHLDSVRRLRNAAAHNTCMISNLKPQSWFKSDIEINFELLGANLEVGNGVISSCLKVPVLNDFAVMLSNYVKLISSPKIKEKTLEEMQEFFNGRMILHKDYFENVNEIKNAYHFAKDVLDYYCKKV